ncbi:unnamed protein product [Lupinus luteus]|uniref:Ubiquinol-cytochrome c reductase complex 6.7 kDa protein n=1 Tax=Lupinus luteus TaxID=3873 RepID=A0AAV1W7U2_LUPLU
MAALPAKLRLQPSTVKSAALWGVTAATGALYLVQPWGWIKKTFLEKPETEQK